MNFYALMWSWNALCWSFLFGRGDPWATAAVWLFAIVMGIWLGAKFGKV